MITRDQLINILQAQLGLSAYKKEKKDYKYVVYARLSRDDPEGSNRSLPDQIIECNKLIKDKGLLVSWKTNTRAYKRKRERPKT